MIGFICILCLMICTYTGGEVFQHWFFHLAIKNWCSQRKWKCDGRGQHRKAHRWVINGWKVTGVGCGRVVVFLWFFLKHRENSMVLKVQRGQVVGACVWARDNLKFSALSAAVSGGDARRFTIKWHLHVCFVLLDHDWAFWRFLETSCAHRAANVDAFRCYQSGSRSSSWECHR